MAHGSTRSKARKRALDILFEAELRDTDPVATLEERAADANPPVRDIPPSWSVVWLPI
jgi:N utilization substance protein B